MTPTDSDVLTVHDLAPPEADVLGEVLAGLSAPQKTLPCKLFYDERGSQLFTEITRQPEYYPTRTESLIMRANVAEMSDLLGPDCLLIELGSGSSEKTKVLLEARDDWFGYVPIDISGGHLLAASRQLSQQFAELRVMPVRADYSAAVSLPDEAGGARRKVVFFPGSTIGNFTRQEATAFLRRIAEGMGPGSGLLIGVDLKKDPDVLNAAYNDAAGVTAAFNKNSLVHINRKLGADFDLEAFQHYAFYNAGEGRVEMHLVSRDDQVVSVGGQKFRFARWETVHTEYSHKFTIPEFAAMANGAGFMFKRVWTDSAALFSVHYLEVAAKP